MSVSPASRNVTTDILMFALAAAMLMVVEARKHNVLGALTIWVDVQ